jgi:hypothetical protein
VIYLWAERSVGKTTWRFECTSVEKEGNDL